MVLPRSAEKKEVNNIKRIRIVPNELTSQAWLTYLAKEPLRVASQIVSLSILNM
jgi:hypothetical protein